MAADDDEFVLLASDGLFDVLKDQDAVDFLHKKMTELRDVQRAVEVCCVLCVLLLSVAGGSILTRWWWWWRSWMVQAMVEHAIFQQRSTDNVTAVVIMFKEVKELLARV